MKTYEKYLVSEKSIDKGYKVAQNPKDKLWYVVGHTGGKYWIPIGDGYKNRKDAEKRVHHQYRADRSAKKELQGWSGGISEGKTISEDRLDALQSKMDSINKQLPMIKKKIGLATNIKVVKSYEGDLDSDPMLELGNGFDLQITDMNRMVLTNDAGAIMITGNLQKIISYLKGMK